MSGGRLTEDGSKGQYTIEVSKEEHATILAALRFWQRVGYTQDCPEQDIATCGGELDDSLAPFEIDDLCERINT